MSELSRVVGEQMRRIRNKKQLTLLHVSKRAGISIANLSFYETGKKEMSIAVLYRWCQALNVKLSAPFRHIEDKRRPKS